MKIPNQGYQINRSATNHKYTFPCQKESEKYQTLISQCLYAVFLADNTGHLLEANHIALSIFGYSTQEISSLTIEDILVLISEPPRQALQSADTTYNLFTLATGIRKNKEHFPVEYTSVMFTDADGNSRTSIMVKDVTDQENGIRLFAEKLRLLELSEKAGNTGSWSWNLASHSFDCSDNFLKLCGYGETVDKAVNLFEIVHPHQKEKLISCIQQVVETGTSKETEFTVIGEDSRERPLLFHIHPVKDADAGINSIAGTIVPIDHTKKTVDFRPMVESIRDGFFMLDNDWIITYWNREIEEISGVKSEKVVGRSFWDFFSSLGNLKLYSECRKAKQLNTSSRFEEFIQYNNAWIEVQVYPSEEGLSVFFKNITDKKNAEEAMRLSNERFDLVVKATNDLVWDWDIIKGEIYRNDSGVERVFGHKSTEQMKTNQQWLDFIHPDDRARIDEQIAYYISSDKETSFNFEYRFRREDGEYNYINDHGYIIRNKLGIVVRMIGAARDVTEQKKIAKEIEESEQRYKMFVQQSTEGIWRIELNKPIPVDMPVEQKISHCLEHAYLAECNDTFACMYGFEDAASMSGIPLIKIMPPDNPVNIGYLRRFFSNNFKVTDEISYEYNRAGNRQTFTNNMIGIVENGYIKRAWGTQREITKQKKAEEMLLASEEQYRSLFDESPFCIIVWDITDFSIVKVNQACIDLYGYSREEFLKLTVLDIRPKEDRDSFREFAKKLHETPPHKTTMIAKHITRKKESIYMDITGHPIVYEGKRCMMAMSNNVTEKVQLEKSLNAERKIRQKQVTDAMLTGQERERLELGEELHDNINQILASARLYIECSLQAKEPCKEVIEKGRVLLDSAMAEIRKLSKTLLPPSLGDTTLLESLCKLAKDMATGNNIVIHQDWEDFNEADLGHKLKLTIFRIIQEQLNNVIKHAKAKNVRISLSRNENELRLSVKDDGVGFDPAVRSNGVGLRNISSRAEVNNGTREIISAPGAGCELIVTFKTDA